MWLKHLFVRSHLILGPKCSRQTQQWTLGSPKCPGSGNEKFSTAKTGVKDYYFLTSGFPPK